MLSFRDVSVKRWAESLPDIVSPASSNCSLERKEAPWPCVTPPDCGSGSPLENQRTKLASWVVRCVFRSKSWRERFWTQKSLLNC